MSEELDRKKKLALMIGLCARAGKLIYGCDGVCAALAEKKRSKTPYLVLEATGVSENTHKRLSDKCAYYNVRKEILPIDPEELAHATGKVGGLIAALAVTDEQMSRAVISFLPESQNQS